MVYSVAHFNLPHIHATLQEGAIMSFFFFFKKCRQRSESLFVSAWVISRNLLLGFLGGKILHIMPLRSRIALC